MAKKGKPKAGVDSKNTDPAIANDAGAQPAPRGKKPKKTYQHFRKTPKGLTAFWVFFCWEGNMSKTCNLTKGVKGVIMFVRYNLPAYPRHFIHIN